jgi:predicted transcriptional regulator
MTVFFVQRKDGYNMIYDGEKIKGLKITITEDMIKDMIREGLEGCDLTIYALLKDLTKENDAIFSPDAKEVAECLDISTHKAMESLDNLVARGFVDRKIIKVGDKLLACEYLMPADNTRRKISRTVVSDVKTYETITIEKPARQ